LAADKELGAAREFVLRLVERDALKQAEFIECMGLLRLRMGAHICNKRTAFSSSAMSTMWLRRFASCAKNA